MPPLSVAFVSVVPSPYQRDLFAALARRPGLSTRVYYLEAGAPDSPWPEVPLASYEEILPGFWFGLGKARVHVNWRLPDLSGYDVVVLNTLMSVTAQWLMRVSLRRERWVFWGERLKRGGSLHQFACAPLNRAAAIAGIGKVACDDYRSRFRVPDHFNIPYFCDVSRFGGTVSRERELNREITFLFCGQMIARKGVDVLLSAFQQLDSRARLLLVGREAELPELLARLPGAIRGRIHYAGFQSPEALPAFFSQADAFVLPSRYDGWGVVVNQAVGAGLPIICSDAVGAAVDLVRSEVNGFIVPSGDADALALAMQRLLDSPETIRRWGDASSQMAAELSPDRGAEIWHEALATVSNR